MVASNLPAKTVGSNHNCANKDGSMLTQFQFCPLEEAAKIVFEGIWKFLTLWLNVMIF